MIKKILYYWNKGKTYFNNNVEKENNICFICYENKFPILKLKNIKYYIKYCECNINIHLKCFEEWFNIYSTCPICIRIIHKKNTKYNNIINTKLMLSIKQKISILF